MAKKRATPTQPEIGSPERPLASDDPAVKMAVATLMAIANDLTVGRLAVADLTKRGLPPYIRELWELRRALGGEPLPVEAGRELYAACMAAGPPAGPAAFREFIEKELDLEIPPVVYSLSLPPLAVGDVTYSAELCFDADGPVWTVAAHGDAGEILATATAPAVDFLGWEAPFNGKTPEV